VNALSLYTLVTVLAVPFLGWLVVRGAW